MQLIQHSVVQNRIFGHLKERQQINEILFSKIMFIPFQNCPSTAMGRLIQRSGWSFEGSKKHSFLLIWRAKKEKGKRALEGPGSVQVSQRDARWYSTLVRLQGPKAAHDYQSSLRKHGTRIVRGHSTRHGPLAPAN